mmetsp:Transcript_104420/g.265016  ORF Transcript_104420/g.265016 Transcript_104420/m.265016 type:complete len:375 (+) Transcript_104420:58-1182(+)
MFFRSRKVVCTKDAVAEIEVSNFAAACAFIDKVSQGKAGFREVSGPTMVIDNFQFDVCIVWGVDAQGHPDRDQELGIYIRRLDTTDEPSVINFEIQILNRTAKEHRKLQDTMFRSLTRKQSRGWSPSFHDPCGIPGITLAKILDESQGWLHDGVLRVTCRLSVVTGFGKEDSTIDMSDTQQGLRDSFKALLESQLFSDVTLKVGSEHIHAHSLVLASRSSVFLAMFSSRMRESRERVVDIGGLDPVAMKELVSFFYTGEVSAAMLGTDDSALTLLQAAHRYDAPAVVEKCTAVLRARLSPENVSERLELADMIDCATFKGQCLDFMRQHIHEVQGTRSYAQLSERRPSLLRDIIAAMAGPAPKRHRSHPSTEGG